MPKLSQVGDIFAQIELKLETWVQSVPMLWHWLNLVYIRLCTSNQNPNPVPPDWSGDVGGDIGGGGGGGD